MTDTHIVEGSKAKSDAVLHFLDQHCAKANFRVRFRWAPHAIAFWDNRRTQHLAVWGYFLQGRSSNRHERSAPMYRKWLILLSVACLFLFATGATFTSLGIVLFTMMAELHWSRTAAGALATDLSGHQAR